MSKIKLSILLLISILIFSCANNKISLTKQKYAVGYIDGEFDGLILKNYLTTYLKNLDIYDQNSKYTIKANIEHKTKLFITNIDNTSDREKIDTKLTVHIENTEKDCNIFRSKINISQFYIYASTDKFLSNQKALKKIKKDNTENAVKKLINKISRINHECDIEE